MSGVWDHALFGAPLAGVTWAERADADAGERLIAPEGDGAWRHMAWPVADEVFALAPAPPGAGVLVAGGSVAEREAVVVELEGLDCAAQAAERLSPNALLAAAVVVMLGGRDALPAAAFVPLASGRVLVAPRRRRAFGLQAGVQFLDGASPRELAREAQLAVIHPEAFAMLRALGRIAARPQRASAVNARLAVRLDR